VRVRLEIHTRTVEEEYNEWVKSRPPPLFGAHPDAKVMNAAATLGEAHVSPVLDIGAGTGRNALPLARLGHPTVAVEMVSALCDQLRQAQASEMLPLQIVQADVLSPQVVLERGRYRLAVLSEVVTHFRDVAQIRVTFSKLSDALAPGATLLFNARSDFAFLETELPLRKISDESAHDYEKAHAAPTAWPPTNWYVSWSRGRNLFDLPEGKGPVELRWLLYQRR
jgi:2-polyprenyl-3-methyl-5-hydroxy-6-metoxy-1,4-benzoquinol methylase